MARPIQMMAILCLFLALSACDDTSKKPAAGGAPQGPPPVRVGHAIQKRLTEWDTFTGRFRARNRVEIRARVSGYLQAIHFKDGERVKKGDLLFEIDPRPFEIALQKAEADLALAKQNQDRIAGLISTGAVSRQELDQTNQQMKTATASVRDAQLNITYSQIRAPISGRAGRHQVDIGNVVNGDKSSADTILTTIVADDPIDFYFEASEQELLKYIRLDKEGKRESSRTAHREVKVMLQDETQFVHEGVIDFVNNEVDRESGTLEARATFPNPDGVLLSGMFGRARLAGSGEYDAVLVPDDVVGTNQTKKFVFVVGKDNKLEPHPVELGPIYQDNLRIIRSGITPEDTIVLAGLTLLQPGMQITPKMDDATPPDGGAKPDAKPADAAPPADSKPQDISKNAVSPDKAPADKGAEKAKTP